MTVNLLEVNYYRQVNADLTNLTDEQLVNHFLTTGLNENRSFSRFVDLNFYRASNPDIDSFSQAALYEHLANSGVLEGRRFSQFVDLDFYGSFYSDLATLNNEQRFEHLRNTGLNEGRVFSQFADLNFYRAANNDIAALNNIQLFEHLRNSGLAEGRRFSQFVNLDLYQLLNPDLVTANLSKKSLLEHLEISGLPEGRRFSLSFDPNFYKNLSLNSDISNLNNEALLKHFEVFGLAEGRLGSDTFNAGLYRLNSPDLALNGFTTNSQALVHFELLGFKENRILSDAGFRITQEPGDTLNNAADLGIILGKRTTNLIQELGNLDRDDIYHFTLATITNIGFTINSSNSEVNAQLIYDRNNDGLIESDDKIFSSNTGSLVNFNKTLGIGTYYIVVSTPRTDSLVNYSLVPNATTIAITTPADPGLTLTTALNLGTINNSTVSLQDFVGAVDDGDIYRFSLNSISNVGIQITGLSGQDSLDGQLIFDKNNNGQIEVEYIDSDTSTSTISLFKSLGIGTYYVRIQPSSTSSNTNYQVSVTATSLNAPTTPSDPGDSVPTAFNIGILSENRVYSDFVGTADRRDIYRFNIINPSQMARNVQFTLDNLTEYVNASLVYDVNQNGQIEVTEPIIALGRSSSFIASTQSLQDGTYFLLIDSSSFQSNSIYQLSLNLL